MFHRARANLLLATTLLFVVACQTTNPLAIAQTPEQKYAAAKLTYDAVLSAVQTFVADSSIPADARRGVQAAAARSGELYKSLNGAYVEYVAAKAQLAAGTTTSDKLTVASANLLQWEQQLEQAIGGIATALKR